MWIVLSQTIAINCLLPSSFLIDHQMLCSQGKEQKLRSELFNSVTIYSNPDLVGSYSQVVMSCWVKPRNHIMNVPFPQFGSP